MSFWDKVNENIKRAVDEGVVAIKEGAKVASEKGGEVAKVGKLKFEAYNKHKEAQKKLAKLGGMVFDMAKPPFENPLCDPEVMKVIESIKEAEKEVKEIEARIEEAGSESEDVADEDKEK